MKLKALYCIAAVIFITCLSAWAGNQKMMSVHIKKGQLRTAPSFIGKITGNLNYGDRVLALDEKQGWIKVSLPNSQIQGWIHKTALTKKNIMLKAGASNVQKYATSSEVALAGKGFNTQVEQAFKAKNPDMDFTWVDKMEAIKISSNEINEFLKQGDVFPQGGSR